MSNKARKHALSAAIVSVLLLFATSETLAQSDSGSRRDRQSQKSGKAEELYPQAERKAPEAKASKMASKMQKMLDLYNDNKEAEARAAADAIIADEKANAYERAFANQIAAQAAYGQDDSAAAKKYLQQAIEANALDNNGHYQAMFMLAQLQMQDEQYAEALATLDKFLAETKAQKPEYLVTRGNILYRLERYPEAITALKQGIDSAGDAAKPDWQQVLMAAYFDSDKPEEAAKVAEGLLAKNPNDLKLQNNMAAIYMQAGQNDKAIALLEKMRAAGQLTDEKQYRNLYATYLNTENKEKEAIAVIEDGFQKGILKPTDYQPNLALAQAYYFSDQIPQAIEAYKKAAPLSPDGETFLNLARVYWQNGNIGEAKKAAQQALDKGLKKPEEAKKILALKGG
ncbi:tetratricopeptide repeat protein [Luteimonas aquatica]|uniref:tetratricopeptide repeat protein n=1 Tax=Luteimonas aquatica TaxID=450364 RepID=UPI003CE5A3BE